LIQPIFYEKLVGPRLAQMTKMTNIDLGSGKVAMLWGETRLRKHHSFSRRNRSALVMTDTELKLMAAPAIMGLSSTPKNG